RAGAPLTSKRSRRGRRPRWSRAVAPRPPAREPPRPAPPTDRPADRAADRPTDRPTRPDHPPGPHPGPRGGDHVTRTPTPRHYLMCRPTYFDVTYEINPWMDVTRHTDTARAVAQWETLRAHYLEWGHTVELIDPIPGLPDRASAAHGGS